MYIAGKKALLRQPLPVCISARDCFGYGDAMMIQKKKE